MQLVYFLLLPSALISIQLNHFAAFDDSSVAQALFPMEWQAVLNIWLVVGCFGLAALWLEKAQQLCLQTSVVCVDLGRPVGWILHNRVSLLLSLWCILQPICLVSSGWMLWTTTVSANSNSQAYREQSGPVHSTLANRLPYGQRCGCGNVRLRSKTASDRRIIAKTE